ncbi:probable pectinesterase/pectinesterase inhibitor 12 [Quercus robur]|uniref:probable pectinesterase/pectinesterase inhibitor 12 n=1 Tax=Quercus robur TaxID=38942 RepID=UPI0021615E7D|nr:probable pectinesterase/pectinesterase inhibitor 12 [Quercus robur]
MASLIILKVFLLLSAISLSRTWALNFSSSSSSSSSLQYSQSLSSIKSICKTTPYPDVCFDSLKLSIGISININPNIITYLLQTLQTAISESENLSNLFLDAGRHSNIIEKQRGTIQDCKEVHQITLSALQRSVSRIHDAPNNKQKLADARAYLSAALTNKNTCLEGLDSASGPLKPTLLNSIHDTYKHVSNSLSIMSSQKGHTNRRLMDMGVPTWISRKLDSRTRILESEYDHVLTVATDGTGNFTTITDAINFAPNNSYNERTFIYVKQGVYDENVEIPDYKPNIVLLGDGADVTLITGDRSMGDGWTIFRSATLGVSGNGFLARDISVENKAGAEKYQAVALRINADLVALYKCSISGFQDTLYVHSFRQFYRECDIFGTIDFIFGNAAVVFQGCNIVSRMPMPGQFTVITAQSRDTLDENTGISFQNCSILGTNDLYSNSSSVKSYLGRPWRVYSQTVYLESYIDNFIDPAGWTQWASDDDRGLDTLYYGEYDNYGLGSSTDYRVTWPGYHVMDIVNIFDAYNFTVSEFITGDEWLDSTSFPYDDGV